MKHLILKLISYILLILFSAGFIVMAPVVIVIDILFWTITDTKIGWFVKKIWDCRKAIGII